MDAAYYITSTFYHPLEEVAISAANYNYNHYNLPFSHIMIIVTILDEDMLLFRWIDYSALFFACI